MSGKPNKDQRIISLLAMTLEKLDDFSGRAAEAEQYATEVVQAVRATAADVEEFRDQVMGVVANVHHLDGELRAAGITPAQLATMQLPEMLSRKQKRELEALSRKRAKEQTDYDKTSMLCKKCGLIRGDRLNINELALDSEESGSHFDYNYDNVCNCSHSSSYEESDEEGDGEDDGELPRGAVADKGTGSAGEAGGDHAKGAVSPKAKRHKADKTV